MNDNSKRNNAKYWIGGIVSVLAFIAISSFSFSYQRSSAAYEMGIQNRERIAVMEVKMDRLAETLDEVRSDVKILLRTYSK